MSHIFFKTRLCLKFSQGNCNHGDTCSFAHGVADLRHPPPNWQQLIRDKEIASGRWVVGDNNNGDQRFPSTTKICKKFFNGEECPYGQKCNFLHQRPFRAGDDTAAADRMYSKPERERKHFDHHHHLHTGLNSSRNHDEVGSMVNSRLLQSKPHPLGAPTGDPFPVVAITNNGHIEQGATDIKNASKWKLNQKIKSIYADWIDDLTDY